MDRKKMQEQAQVLKAKKLARMAQLAKQLRPTVEGGIVKYDVPKSRLQEIKQFSVPTSITRSARTVVPKQLTQQQQKVQQQKISPKQILVNKSKGCSGCRRKIGSS